MGGECRLLLIKILASLWIDSNGIAIESSGGDIVSVQAIFMKRFYSH